jgi:predicted Zn-dependent protease
MTQAVITIDVATPTEDSVVVLVHELGHALGLEHDTYQGSVMYSSASDSGGRILADDRRFVLWQMNQ